MEQKGESTLTREGIVFVNRFFELMGQPGTLTSEEIRKLVPNKEEIFLGDYYSQMQKKIIRGKLPLANQDGIEAEYDLRHERNVWVGDRMKYKSLREDFVTWEQPFSRDCGYDRREFHTHQRVENFTFCPPWFSLEWVSAFHVSYKIIGGKFSVEYFSCVYCNGLPKEGTREYKWVEDGLKALVVLDHECCGSILFKGLRSGKHRVHYSQPGYEGRYNNQRQAERIKQILSLYQQYLESIAA